MPKSKRKKRSKSNKTGYFGVGNNTNGNKYTVSMRINGKTISFGSSYDTAKQAAKAYDREAIKLRRPLFSLNYPKKAPVGYTPIQQPLRSDNAVGYRGVFKRGKKTFQASIMIGGKVTYLGTYDTSKEAAVAYDRAVLKANKSTSLLNFPDIVHNLDVKPKRKKQNVRSDNTSGYKGVFKQKNEKFRTSFYANGKTRKIGESDTAIQAALIYDQAAIKAGRKSHTLNFPDGLPEQVKQKTKKEIFEKDKKHIEETHETLLQNKTLFNAILLRTPLTPQQHQRSQELLASSSSSSSSSSSIQIKKEIFEKDKKHIEETSEKLQQDKTLLNAILLRTPLTPQQHQRYQELMSEK